jgi:hypothetical protein
VTTLLDNVPGSLRDAITNTPAGGTVDFQPGLSGTIVLSGSALSITKNLTVNGPGASVLTINAQNAGGVFFINASQVAMSGMTFTSCQISNGGTLTLAGVTVTRNAVANIGGGISNSGTLSLTDATVSGNAAAAWGGGIYNSGTLTVTDSAISGNSCNVSQPGLGGGGICNFGTVTVTHSSITDTTSNAGHISGDGGSAGISSWGTVTVIDSTISGNTANITGDGSGDPVGGIGLPNGTLTVIDSAISNNRAAFGGGILVGNNIGATVQIIDSTISGNAAEVTGQYWGGGGGGGILILGAPTTVTLTGCTVTDNSSVGHGGGICNWDSASKVLISNTIVAGNTAPTGPDMDGALASQGHNLIGNSSGGSGYTVSDLVGTGAQPLDPKLGPLQNNGGPTQTMALLPGSPAIGGGDPTNAPAYDQRGPGYPRVVNGSIDIGAFEVQPPSRVITGMPGVDNIVFTLGATASNLTVRVNGMVSSLSNVTNIEIEGQGGGDSITITDTAAAHFGVSANDMLVNGVDIFSADANLTWTLVGQGGGDTFALEPGASASLIARQGNNTLVGPDAASAWTITGKGTGTVAAVTFQGFATLVGGNAANTFHIEAGGVIGNMIDGGPGGDTGNTLVGPDTPGTQWYIASTDAGTVGPNYFTHIGNLVGGASWDVFRLSDGVGVSGKIDGGGGGNLLDYAAYTTGVVVNMTTGVATNVAGGIANIQSATGGSASDLLIGNDQNNILIGGNGGNDTLIGGRGHDVLVGGDGNDLLIGGPNRSVLIGGTGHDTLIAGNGDDLLIAGATPWDFQGATDALVAIRNEWIRLDESFAQRISNLRGDTSGGVSGSYVLNTTTVTEAGATDALTGGGGTNWFWADQLQDTITDLGSADQVN